MIYYISETGSSLGSGSYKDPINFQALLGVPLVSGDEVLFKSGDKFKSPILNSVKGVKFGKYGDSSNPEISLFLPNESWRNVGNGVYQVSNYVLPSNINILSINSVVKAKGRFPESGYLNVLSGHAGGQVSVGSLPFNPVGGEVVIRKEKYITDTYKITGFSEGVISYTNDGSTYPVLSGYGCFIQNHLSCLTQFGDWSYDSVSKTLSMYLGNVSPLSFDIKIPSGEPGILFNGCEDIIFSDIDVNGVNGHGIQFVNSKNIILSGVSSKNTGLMGVYAADTSCNDISIINSSFKDNVLGGAYFGYLNNRISVIGSEFENCGLIEGGAFTAGNSDSKGIGLTIQLGSHNSAIKNTVKNVGFNGISVNGTGAKIIGNTISNFSLNKADSSGIYLSIGAQVYTVSESIEIKNNSVTGGYGHMEGTNETEPIVYSVYMDDNQENVVISNNKMYRSRGGGLYLHNTDAISVLNNEIVGNKRQVSIVQNGGLTVSNTIVTDNKLICESPDQSFVICYGLSDHGDWSGNEYFYAGDVAVIEKDADGVKPYNLTISEGVWETLSGEDGSFTQLLSYDTTQISPMITSEAVVLGAGKADNYIAIGEVAVGDLVRVYGSVLAGHEYISLIPELDFDGPYGDPRGKRLQSGSFDFIFKINHARANEKIMALTETGFLGTTMTISAEIVSVETLPSKYVISDSDSSVLVYGLGRDGESIEVKSIDY